MPAVSHMFLPCMRRVLPALLFLFLFLLWILNMSGTLLSKIRHACMAHIKYHV